MNSICKTVSHKGAKTKSEAQTNALLTFVPLLLYFVPLCETVFPGTLYSEDHGEPATAFTRECPRRFLRRFHLHRLRHVQPVSAQHLSRSRRPVQRSSSTRN